MAWTSILVGTVVALLKLWPQVTGLRALHVQMRDRIREETMNHDERQAQAHRLMTVLIGDETAALITESVEVVYPTHPA
jgi:hypothetical protein